MWKLSAVSDGGMARWAAVATAPAVAGASRLLRPPLRQRRPGVPYHLHSQHPVFTKSHFISQNKAIYSAKTNLLSQRKPLYAYDITFFCHPVPNLHRIRISAKRYQFILRKQNYSDNGNLFSFFIGHVDILGGIDKSKSGSFSFW